MLFIVLFLGIISWKGASRFDGGGLFFRCGDFTFKWGCAPWGGISFDGGGGLKKNHRRGGRGALIE